MVRHPTLVEGETETALPEPTSRVDGSFSETQLGFPPVSPVAGVIEIDELVLKFTWKCKRSRIAIKNLEKREQSCRTPLLDFKTYYKSTVTTTAQRRQDRQADQWGRTGSPKRTLTFRPKFLLGKGATAIQWRKGVFSASSGMAGYSQGKERIWP